MEKREKPVMIDGKVIAKTIKEEIAKEVQDLLTEGKRPPHLVAVIVGEASRTLPARKNNPKK